MCQSMLNWRRHAVRQTDHKAAVGLTVQCLVASNNTFINIWAILPPRDMHINVADSVGQWNGKTKHIKCTAFSAIADFMRYHSFIHSRSAEAPKQRGLNHLLKDPTPGASGSVEWLSHRYCNHSMRVHTIFCICIVFSDSYNAHVLALQLFIHEYNNCSKLHHGKSLPLLITISCQSFLRIFITVRLGLM